MDPEFDEIIRNLPADFDEKIMEEARRKKRKSEEAPATIPKRARKLKRCGECGKEVSTRDMARHRRVHQQFCYDCIFCNYKGGSSLDYMRHHYRKFHADANHKCKNCGWQFASEDAFFEEPHLSTCIKCVGQEHQPVEPLPVDDNAPLFFHDPLDPPEGTEPFWADPIIAAYADNDDVVALVNNNWSHFRQHFSTDSALVHEYRFRTTGVDVHQFTIANALKHIYSGVNAVFNINFGITSLLRRDVVGGPSQFKIFTAENNRQNILERNVLIHDLVSLSAAIDKIEALGDMAEYIKRPNTEWKVAAILGFTFYTYIRPNYVGGRGNSSLPSYLTYNTKTVVSMERDDNGHIHTDNLCLFRCIVAGQKGDHNDMATVTNAYETYRTQVGGPHWRQFGGVPDEHLPLVEDSFGINIQIYRKTSSRNVVCLRKATNTDRPVINIHSHPIDVSKVHYSFILNFHNFGGRHHCQDCGRMFKRKQDMDRHHQHNCKNGEPEHTYRDGCYEAALTIFDRMAEFGIFVEPERRKCDSFAVWDMEACLEPLQLVYQLKAAEKENERIQQRLHQQRVQVENMQDEPARLQLRERHRPVTSAIASTVEGASETRFFFNANPEDLMKNELLPAMLEMSEKNYQNEKAKFSSEFAQLDRLIAAMESSIEGAGDNDMKREKSALKKLKRFQQNLDRQCRQLTMLGFNSGRYDLNLVKSYLFPQLTAQARLARNEKTEGDEATQQWPKSITRGSSILCLQTKELRFLDVALYCGPGTNLDKFVRTFNPGGDVKGCFPYELVRCPEDLERITEFPPKSAFYSVLKDGEISQHEYEGAKAIWDSLPEPRNLLRYIEWYNTRDVEPFLVACKNMHSIFYNDFGIDIWRRAQSLPGVCLAFLSNRLQAIHPTTSFGLFNTEQGELCQQLYQSMTGGLAIIVNRWAEKDKTPIRGNPDILVKKILGLDFNALYLWAMCQDMSTGYPDHWTLNEDGDSFGRKSETMADKLKRRRTHGEVTYMRFAAFRDQVYIHHAGHGQQTQLLDKQYRVDGFAKDAKPRPRVYEYHGCYYHCHTDGCLNKKINLDNANGNQAALDQQKYRDLTDAGYDVKVTWECEFKAIKDLEKEIRKKHDIRDADRELVAQARVYNLFLQQHPIRTFHSQRRVTYRSMEDAILNGGVFGFAQVDVETPQHLKEAFSDFPAIIKKADVSIDDIGPFMRGIAEATGQLDKPRTCLINSYFGNKVWMMTPLIQLYQEIGLTVTKVHQVVQFDRRRPFEWFGNTVTENRKRGDIDPEKATLGTIFKLLGNSAYGKTITNLTKHMNCYYADAAEATNAHSDPYHHRTAEITPDCYEILKRKEQIEFNLPFQIGLSVYAWAKWRVIKFIYMVLQKYVPRSCYDFLESDTDSIYLALSKDTLKDCVPPEKMAEFEEVEKEWFVLDDSQMRTPGLLKVETEGTGFVGLSAKSYVVLQDESGKQKQSAKGVQVRSANANLLSFENYKSILFGTGGETTAFNFGIRPLKGAVYSYVQAKTGLGPLYVKRVCQEDHRTLPLEI